MHEISLSVNGETVRERVEARKTLVDFLREDLGLTGSHIGCEHGVCGACTVRIDGTIMRGCLVLAVQCNGARVETIEGASDSGEIADLQEAFQRRNALQCGYCTPGMLLSATYLLSHTPKPSEDVAPIVTDPTVAVFRTRRRKAALWPGAVTAGASEPAP